MEIQNIFSWQNLTFTITLIVILVFLKSGIVKQLIDNLKQLGSAQESLLKAKERQIGELEEQIKMLEAELKDEKKENKRLRNYDFDNREELSRLRLSEKSNAPNKEEK